MSVAPGYADRRDSKGPRLGGPGLAIERLSGLGRALDQFVAGVDVDTRVAISIALWFAHGWPFIVAEEAKESGILRRRRAPSAQSHLPVSHRARLADRG